MSQNDVKVSQEMYNALLDTMTKVGTLEKSLRETREHLRNTQLKVKELETKILQHNTNVNFTDIFRKES